MTVRLNSLRSLPAVRLARDQDISRSSPRLTLTIADSVGLAKDARSGKILRQHTRYGSRSTTSAVFIHRSVSLLRWRAGSGIEIGRLGIC
jgi:hypothetical protein